MAKKQFKTYQCEEINSIVELAERSKRLYGDSAAYIYKEKKKGKSRKIRARILQFGKNSRSGCLGTSGAFYHWN